MGERLTATFFRFLKQGPPRHWYSDASYQAVDGYFLGAGWLWRHGLSEDERNRTVKTRARISHDSLSINVLERFGMVWTAYVVIVIRKDLPGREEENVPRRGDNSTAVQ